MLSLGGQVKVFLAAQPTDMRKSFDTLAALVHEVLQLDPLSGHLKNVFTKNDSICPCRAAVFL
jgi:transposase